MQPFIVKPGETIVGLGLDFVNRLASEETISEVNASTPSAISIVGSSATGTKAAATISIPSGLSDSDLVVNFTVTGTAGSVRKGSRLIWVRADSE
jgi:flavin-binding protein dodecin